MFHKDGRREIHYDVIVCGGGPSGICAAMAAAREGVSVALIERYGILGGCLTSANVGPILGDVGLGTMRDEMTELLGVRDNDMLGWTGVAHDVEKAKIVLAQFVAKEKIDVFLQTMAADVVKEHDEIKGVVIAGKEGLRVLTSDVVIDATGDGDIAYFAGCPYEKGREQDALMQPVTLEFTISGVDETRAIACIGDVDDVTYKGERFLDFTARCAREGILPPGLAAVRLHRTTVPGERRVNTTQVNGVDSTDTRQLFPAEVELRNQIEILMDFFHHYLDGYENCRLISSAVTLGVRESRRIMGAYMLCRADVTEGRRFEDVIVHRAEFVVDIHNPAGAGQAEPVIQYAKPYDIPYRCIVPQEIDRLLLTGRCISATHSALASCRVMTVCMALGQAAGIAAAMCSRDACVPRQLDVKKLQARMTELGIELFDNPD